MDPDGSAFFLHLEGRQKSTGELQLLQILRAVRLDRKFAVGWDCNFPYSLHAFSQNGGLDFGNKN